jgi:FAD/FMN-containing dehydrogenase
VPQEKFKEYLDGIYGIFERNGLRAAVWGHAGNANLHMQPFLDLGQVGDRQKVFKVMDEYYKMVINMGGSTSGEHGDGRLRGPYLAQLYGNEMYALFQKLKAIFDPYNTLNPGVKVNVSLEAIKSLLRQDYAIDHLYDHMPRS